MNRCWRFIIRDKAIAHDPGNWQGRLGTQLTRHTSGIYVKVAADRVGYRARGAARLERRSRTDRTRHRLMMGEEDIDLRAHQLLAQIQSGPPEAALGFVRDHLEFVAGKGCGKGDTRFAPH